MALILKGMVVTMDDAQPLQRDGAIYVSDDGLVDSIAPASAPAAFQGAPRVQTDGFIYPGLIDLHSHMGYNTLPLWSAKSAPFEHHDSWPGKDDYGTAVTWPYRIFSVAAPEAVLKYAEVKALIGGTTAIQGKPKTSRSIDGWLVRVIDDEQLGQPGDFVHTATIPKTRGKDLDDEAARLMAKHTVFVPHVAEGRDARNYIQRHLTPFPLKTALGRHLRTWIRHSCASHSCQERRGCSLHACTSRCTWDCRKGPHAWSSRPY